MKTVLVGVTGCVAAYKACEIVRGLQKAGHRVKVVMTDHACEFVQPAQFRALTREPVAVGLFDDAPGDPIHHVSLAKEADLFVVAPATANILAKMAHGIADDLLSTTALATTAPVLAAPAMNVAMYEHAATQANMRQLRERGVHFVEPGEGYLACGDTGRGRLADPADIVQVACALLQDDRRRDLEGKTVLITTGPTQEPIDPVRFISNPSSGKTGFALAEAARDRGAAVALITGPVSLADPAGVETMRVTTALQMHQAVQDRFAEADVAVFAAAVSDYRPAEPAASKMKKGADDERLRTITLVENPDILAQAAHGKRPGQVVVGFAAETEDVEANARKKLQSKNADIIVGNLAGEGRAFGTDDNEVVIVTQDGAEKLGLMPKRQLADAILDRALALT